MLFWFLVGVLVFAILALIALFRGAEESQTTREMRNLLGRLQRARTAGDREQACEIAQELIDFLDAENLQGTEATAARTAAEAVLETCE